MKHSFIPKISAVFSPLYLILLQCKYPITGFNIDTENPILITNSFDRGSLFGFSVILLPPSNSSYPNGYSTKGWVLIGAPKGNSSHANHTQTNEPGVIWRCSLGRDTLEANECRIVVMDPTGEHDPKIRAVAHMDSKNGGWLGGSMSVGSERFVACASRWCNQKYFIYGTRTKDLFMNGICYWVNKSHLQSESVNGTWPWLPDKHSYRLLPLVDIMRRSVWSHGLAGFSAHLTGGDVLIIGAPGVSTGSGAVVEYSDNANPAPSYKRYNSNGDKAFAQFLVSQGMDTTAEGNIFEYFGYAVTSGHYFRTTGGRNSTQYVAGAPRAANLRGKVYAFMLRKPTTNGQNNSDAEIDLIDESIEGPDDSFSYFGSVLCTSDVNHDGFDDLLVGAPYYSKQADQISGPGEQGCVFLYTSNGEQFNKSAVKICESEYRFSYFGSSISALGDINGDGFPDVAIGAPRENIRGAVYIYMGSNAGLRLSQKLTPQSVHSDIRGFGSALSPGTDIDGNLYPDLAVGSFMSEQVVVYRSIPVVSAVGQIKADISQLWSNVYNFSMTSCISFYGKSLPQMLEFVVDIALDVKYTRKKGPLIKWDLPGVNNISGIRVLNMTSTTLQFISGFKNGTCYTLPVIKVQDTTSQDQIKLIQVQDLYRAESSNKNVSMIHYEINRIADGSAFTSFSSSGSEFASFYNKTPVIQNLSPVETMGELDVSTFCYDDKSGHICKPNLCLSVHAYDSNSGGGDDANETKQWVVRKTNQLAMTVTVENVGEYAHSPIKVRLFSEIFSYPYIWITPRTWIKIDDPVPHFYGEIGEPIRKGNKAILNATIHLSNIFYGETKNLAFNISAEDRSGEATFHHEMLLSLAFQSRVQFFIMKKRFHHPKRSTASFPVSQNVTMELAGPSPVYAIQLQFYIPKVLRLPGKDANLLEITGIHVLGGKVKCKNDEKDWTGRGFTQDANAGVSEGMVDFVDRWNNTGNEFKIINMLPWRTQNKSPSAQNVVIHCGSPNVSCAAIICDPILHYDPEQKTNIGVGLKLAPEHLSFFGGLKNLEIQSLVTAKFLDKMNQALGEEEFHGSLVATIIFQAEGELPAWAVIVGTSTGIILLILFIFGLAKCGFFRRKRRASMQRLLSINQASEFDLNFEHDFDNGK